MLLFVCIVISIICSLAALFIRYRLPPSPDARFFSSILIGHRGVMSEKCDQVAENSISAAHYAFKNGAHAVEIDVMLSLDNHPIVFHDPVSMERVCRPILDSKTEMLTEPKKLPIARISSLMLSEIKKYEFVRGPKHERIPTLHEYLDAIRSNIIDDGKIIMIEVKEFTSRGSRIIAKQLTKVFEQNVHLYRRAVVASFSPIVLYQIRSLDPEIITLLIVKRGILQIYSKEHIKLSTLPNWVKKIFIATAPLWDALMFWCCTTWMLHFLGVGVVAFEHSYISEDLSRVHKYQRRGYQVNVWAVNDEMERQILLDMGVAVTTDWF